MRLPRHAELWGPGYLQSRLRRWSSGPAGSPQRIWVAICDHYEPLWLKPAGEIARQRVSIWRRLWPQIAGRHHDSGGRHPRYSFFFPQEEYQHEFLEPLAEMTRQGIADVEVHIHHDGEGEADFVSRMKGFVHTLRTQHGLLRDVNGQAAFGFIHGNWALDNSLDSGRWCGLNNELTLLRDLGCYADFTMPCGNYSAQASTVNVIYWATDDPARPKSYDRGVELRPGQARQGDLLMIPGPLALRWRERLVPRLDTGEVASQDLPTPYRMRRWLAVAPRLGQDVFIKLYTHGAQERNSSALLENGGLDALYRIVAEQAGRMGARWFGVSAWEMYCAVEALRDGRDPEAAAGYPG
jgi:hypothetical protein